MSLQVEYVNLYRQCTDTSHQTDLTICNICFHQGLHNSHNDQIHTFSCNYESQYFFYYACGILLDSPPEFMQCQKYVDFLLCPHCVKKQFHKGHVYLMEKATLYFKWLYLFNAQWILHNRSWWPRFWKYIVIILRQ